MEFSDEKVVARGLKWSCHKMNYLPKNSAGVYIIFDKQTKAVKIKEHEDIKMGVREEFWKKNFWHFSWFITSPSNYRHDLAETLKQKEFDELWDFT